MVTECLVWALGGEGCFCPPLVGKHLLKASLVFASFSFLIRVSPIMSLFFFHTRTPAPPGSHAAAEGIPGPLDLEPWGAGLAGEALASLHLLF